MGTKTSPNTIKMKYWENINYQNIQDAIVDNGKLITTFVNGDQIMLPLSTLLSTMPSKILNEITAEDLHYTPYQVSIQLESEVKTIPWDKIRVLSDKEFSRFLAGEAESQAKLIGIKIKRLREKKEIKSNELAERSGISAQTISRIEKGHQDVSFSTLRRLLASMGYSLTDLANEEVELANEKAEVKNIPFLLRKMSNLGIDPSFVTQKLIPKAILEELQLLKSDQPDLLLREAASYLSNIYGWSINDIWNNAELSIDSFKADSALFKKGGRTNINQIKAYTPYAFYLAKSVTKININGSILPFPDSIEDFKKILLNDYDGIHLKSILNYSWDMGISVIPLNDTGIFHGAAWNINGKYAIVLKQKVKSHAKWIFDLLHELYHIMVHLKDVDDSIIETSEISAISNDHDSKELEANSFANQIIFNGNSEQFSQEVVRIAKGKMEYLQTAVEQVANSHNLRVDSLANYLAYRLAYQGSQWWPTAESLQVKDPDPYNVSREILLERVDLKKLSSFDYNLLSTALNI